MSGIIGDFGNYSTDYDIVSYIRHILYIWLLKFEKQLDKVFIDYVKAMIKDCEENIEQNRAQLFSPVVGGAAAWQSIGMIQCFFELFKERIPAMQELMKWFDDMYVPFTNAFMNYKHTQN